MMAFSITLNGEKIHEMDIDPRLVTGVRLLTAQGEAGVAGSPLRGIGSDSASLLVDVQQPTTLPMVEDDARLAAEEANNEVSTTNENARRTAALEEVDAEYAEKSADNPEEDYTEEYAAAREAAVNPAAEPAPAPKKVEKTPEKATASK